MRAQVLTGKYHVNTGIAIFAWHMLLGDAQAKDEQEASRGEGE